MQSLLDFLLNSTGHRQQIDQLLTLAGAQQVGMHPGIPLKESTSWMVFLEVIPFLTEHQRDNEN